MKKVECEVIKDLLPSYIDKISSEETNKLVESHLQTCSKCYKVAEEMAKEVSNEPLFNQDKQIDYLKRYRRKKISSIMIAIILTSIILLDVVLLLTCFLQHAEFDVDINHINIEFQHKSRANGVGKDRLDFATYDEKYNLKFYKYELIENTGEKTLHIKTVGKYPFGTSSHGGCVVYVSDDVDRIYFEDAKGNLREVWNKDDGFLIRDTSST